MPRGFRILKRFLKMPLTENGDQYSVWVGLIYVFNLIVGTGALTLPAVFARAGWGLSTASLIFLAFMSFMNVTYVIETMACANAVYKWKRLQAFKRDSIQDHEHESDEESTSHPNGDLEEPLVCGESIPSRYYSLDRRVELGEMADLFLNKTGRTMFYVTLCVYLYGDLSIYAAAVAKSVMDVVCSSGPHNLTTMDSADWDMLPCFNTTGPTEYTRLQCYRVALLTFVGAVGPFVFFNVQKTKYLQLFTSGMRWLAFAIMISIAIHLLISDGPQGHPPAFDVTGLPTLFGACVYSFMCHHSLPGLISPIRGKRKLGCHLALDYGLISIFYLLLAYTGAFAFAHLNDLYTLNFVPTDSDNFLIKIVEYFLTLFPVFTLSTSFPIIAITLRNNLQSLFLDTTRMESYNFVLRKLFFPVVTVVPPLLLTYFLEDISKLIEFTGSYAGTGIQYLIPTFLVVSARRYCSNLLGLGVTNEYKSPFSNIAWAIFVVIWSAMCLILVSVHIFEKS
ncbi:transmembrane protein 104 homolog [Plodia interpunctella]|uniref:transmembrane protein 104 homolog n=1 Tax=Plodia interpunctella TaxID=58824 RepID=UPI0023688A7E|nr:transmembrane protein 104 homolog [Plodia interpunctella]